MNAGSKAVNFKDLARKVTDPSKQWGAEKFSVWASECPEDGLSSLLTDWSIPGEDMPYVVLEYMDRIVFRGWQHPEAQLNSKGVREIERGRVFGKMGDLSFVRGADVWRWYFVGHPDARPPQGFDVPENSFWTMEPDATFLKWEETAMLWGERMPSHSRWFDSRVARAILEYPDQDGGRVWLRYRTFSRGGRVEFVWYLGLESKLVEEDSNA